MPKEVNLTGDQVVAFNERIFNKGRRCFCTKALIYAVDCHSGQYRKSGEPYIIHPIQVAGILAKLKLDAVTVACGFCMTWLKTQMRHWTIWRESSVMMFGLSLTG